MNQHSRSKTSPKVARELWERLTEKPALESSEYFAWHLKHHIEPWLLTAVVVVCCTGMLIMAGVAVLSILVPATSGIITRDILITVQRIIITIYIGASALLLPITVRSHFESKPKTKTNKALAIAAQSVIGATCFVGWLILTGVIYLDNETQTMILLALFIVISLIYIVHTILQRKVSQQNIGFLLLVATAVTTSALALIHLWQ